MDRMIDAFGQAWLEADGMAFPEIGARRRAGLKAVLALLDSEASTPTPSPSPVCEIRAGDTLILAFSEPLNEKQKDRIEGHVAPLLPPNSRALILDGVSQIGVIRGDK